MCDSIVANCDRHWRNFGFVRNIDTLEMRPAPIFDSGNSLWYMKTPAEVAVNDWSFIARPFGPEPDRQLACVDAADWLDAARLEGFVDEATAILAESTHASQPKRLDYIAHGLQERIRIANTVLPVLAYRSRA